MADDINTAINSGGYVIVPEKAVDGIGKDAIYVYMTYNSNGNQAWKIAGGLNGAMLIIIGVVLLLAIMSLMVFAPAVALVNTMVLIPMMVSAISLIMAGVALVNGDLRACSNFFSGAMAGFGFVLGKITALVSAATGAFGFSYLTNDLGMKICR